MMTTFSSRIRVIVGLLATAAAILALAGSASARTIPIYTHTEHYIDGFGSTAGTFSNIYGLDIDQSSRTIYVGDPGRFDGALSRFTLGGEADPFPALGASSISIHSDRAFTIAVDNSNASSQGTVYIDNGKNTVRAFKPDGTELGAPFPLGGFQSSCGIAVDPQGNLWVAAAEGNKLIQYTSLGTPTGKTISEHWPCHLAIDSEGNFYTNEGYIWLGTHHLNKYDPEGHLLYHVNAVSTLGVAVDRSTDNVFVAEPYCCGMQITEYNANGEPLTTFGHGENSFEGLGYNEPVSMAIDETTHDVYVANTHNYNGRQRVEEFAPTSEVVVPTVKTEAPEISPTHATLKASVDLDGAGATTECAFEWGTSAEYSNSLPCEPDPVTAGGVNQVTAELSGLSQGTEYHFRIRAKNADEVVTFGADRGFRPQGPAIVSREIVSEVNTDGARVGAEIDPNGGDTSYVIEYGPEDCEVSACSSLPVPHGYLESPLGAQTVSVVLTGLESGATYHYRVIAENEYGVMTGVDETFTTYSTESTADTCPNALVRKQTGAVLLLDCRAYELVSAANAGGYDVTSDLITGQSPFMALPWANDQVLYSLNYGVVPGVEGEPTNRPGDPYVAYRTAEGWKTRYAGISVGEAPPQGPFGSEPSEESADLSTLAFGPGTCSPCFAGGSTGLSVRRDGGPIAQGMAGDMNPGPSAKPDGYIARQLSADGTHLIFGSTSQFEPDGNSNGDVSIYDRNLVTGATHVVSKTPQGTNLPCLQGSGSCHSPGDGDGIGALAVSENGNRIVIAQRVSTDGAGNRFWHPYMDIGDSGQTVDLAPGTTSGVLFDGMTADGSAVYFTTADPLTADDHDSSPDIYRASVGSNGSLSLSRVSTGSGGTGDTDACDPEQGGEGEHWNSVGSSPDCGAVAFGGGAGVAAQSGAVYFLSPEKLDGPLNGTEGAPNVYVASPGSSPRFVATLEPDSRAVRDAVWSTAARTFGDIQVTPSGAFAAFSSDRSLTGFPTFGHAAIYRYSMSSDSLACVSCPFTGAGLSTDTRLSPYGLNLTDDGRVFFTTDEPLVLRDTGGSMDAYEWNNGRVGLISTGRSATDSTLLSVSADGTNAYFFTRDVLVPQDKNGNTVKIYDARTDGGFEARPPGVPCQASDECHGPGSQPPASNQVPTFEGTGGNYIARPTAKKPRHRRRRHHGRKRHRHTHRRHHRAAHWAWSR
jgi:hypothetical protein